MIIKRLYNLLYVIILLFICSQILIKSDVVIESVSFAFNLWKNNIFPSLFPFFVISELLINYGFVELISEIIGPFMNKVFKCGSNSSFIFIMSILSGIPSNAKYISELYKEGLIDTKEGTKILMFTHFSNPLFILGTLSITFLNNKEVGLLILCTHYITNIIIGILFRNYCPTKEKKTLNLRLAVRKMNKRKNNFGTVLKNSLINSINTMLLILGIVTFFLIITTIIDSNINIPPYYQSIINGILEMTQGLKYISVLDIPLKVKAVLSTMIISFGGFSAHLQVMSILSDTEIKYFPYFISRVIHSLIASILIFIFFDLYFSL
ncbi:MAG: hypothetical protein RSH78_01175 [Bacilli bacterium]